MPESLLKPINIYLAYTHEDEKLLRELESHLAPLKRSMQIEVWHNRMISPGTSWQQEIEAHLDTADIILLLVSPAFMASDYGYSIEMQRAMQRHMEGKTRVIPIILRPTDWHNSPFGLLLRIGLRSC